MRRYVVVLLGLLVVPAGGLTDDRIVTDDGAFRADMGVQEVFLCDRCIPALKTRSFPTSAKHDSYLSRLPEVLSKLSKDDFSWRYLPVRAGVKGNWAWVVGVGDSLFWFSKSKSGTISLPQSCGAGGSVSVQTVKGGDVTGDGQDELLVTSTGCYHGGGECDVCAVILKWIDDDFRVVFHQENVGWDGGGRYGTPWTKPFVVGTSGHLSQKDGKNFRYSRSKRSFVGSK